MSPHVSHWFQRARRIALVCAVAAHASAALAAQVVVGQVAPLSGLQASDGRGYAAGMQLYFSHVNKAGGVNGNTFTLASVDDLGRADNTVSATQQLLTEQRPLLLAGFFGGANLAQLQQSGLLDKEKIALVGYRSGSFQPQSAQFFNVRAGQNEEIGKIAEHLSTVGIKRLGLVFEDGPLSEALQKDAQEAIQKNGGELVAKASYPASSIKVQNAVQSMLKGNPQAIILITTGSAAAAFVEQYRLGGGTARLFASSDVDLEQLTKRLGEDHLKGISIAQVTPNPYKVSSKLSKEFRETHAQAGDAAMPVSYAMMEGYITAKVIVEATRRAGGRITREGLAAALGSIDTLDLGGYAIGYRNGQRTGSRFVELSIVSATGRIRQ